ncbi:uncharacterized protein LOC136071646 [Hydra vulgaris]|uniref:uncharacterized protein LOC136071646 n=1 Tax=Hydra vulgaris TaxID=6087 RepID=UPI001F5F48F1|nr:uncharacterized protein LOC105844852 [Hydra vulgaris]XP_047134789.1 uncharacterized protein LOC105844852 [Hydra vulgaris]
MAASNVLCFTCCTCGAQKYSLKKYLQHLYIMHEHTAGFLQVCNIGGCPSKYPSVKSLRHHMRKKHCTFYNAAQISANESENTISETILDNQILAEHVHDNIMEEFDSITDREATRYFHSSLESTSMTPLDNLLSNLQQHFAMFLVSIAERHSIPSVVQINVANEVQSLLTYFNHCFCTLIKQQLGNNFLYSSDFNELLNCDLLLDRVLSKVNTSKKIISFSKSHLGLILPVEIKLHSITENLYQNHLTTSKSETFQYIPILPLLKKLVENEFIWNSMQRKLEKEESINTDLLSSYSDGFICKKHDLFKDDKYALRLHLYCDEFEVCNPIGAHCTVHKLSAFYFFLGNIEEQYISQLQNINLCILVKEKFIKKYKTYKQVLRPLIQDLLTLQNEGISVMINGKQIQLFGGVATISADNLSAHALAGFRRVFNSGRFCRQCMTSYSEKNIVLTECSAKLRTNEMHHYHLAAISGQGLISSSMYGVEKRCPLLDLSYFSVIQSFPPDIMHDVLEGIIPQLIGLVLIKFKEQHLITLEQINVELNIFEIGRNDKKNKPVPFVSRSGTSINFVGSASQKFCMFCLLPFLIGNRIPKCNKHWLLYLQLRNIADYIFAPKITKTVLPYLQFLVEHFLQNFIELFPNNLTPKFHFMLHYARLISEYGPLRYLWCMRFEAKHLYFKKLASVIRNFKNIGYSLAKRHQLRQCWEMTSSDFFKENYKSSNLCSITFDSLSTCIQEKLMFFFVNDVFDKKETIWKCNAININGTHFHLHDTFILSLLHTEEILYFLKFFTLFNFDNAGYFVVSCLFVTNIMPTCMHSELKKMKPCPYAYQRMCLTINYLIHIY